MTRSSAFRAARKFCGLCLVLAAFSSTAFGRTPPPQNYYPGVPEIDPGSVLSAMTLLGGGLLMITDRRRKAATSKAVS